jgi:hypothetical protein
MAFHETVYMYGVRGFGKVSQNKVRKKVYAIIHLRVKRRLPISVFRVGSAVAGARLVFCHASAVIHFSVGFCL